MEIYLLIGIAALLASLLTFFSGFGLGTLLSVVFIQFFPIKDAILYTALVHLANNIFKTILMMKAIDKKVFILFGITAIPGAFLGAWLLERLPDQTIYSYTFFSSIYDISLLNIIIGILLMIFAIAELTPSLHFKVNKKILPIGGFLSGFFGGLSGHQGALRSSFLIKLGLSKELFIGTGIAVSLLIDLTRIGTYMSDDNWHKISLASEEVLVGIVFALTGAILGKMYLKKITYASLQKIVAAAIILFSIALILGWLNK